MNIGERNFIISKVHENIDKILNRLNMFSRDIVCFYEPANMNAIKFFEKKFNVTLPYDYKYLLSRTNGFSLMGDSIYGVMDDLSLGNQDLFSIYKYEHECTYIPQYWYLVPFAPDGGGNFYCFDTRDITDDNPLCKIVFWQSNYQYSEDDQPEITHDNMMEFISECIINWTLECYDYNGDPL